MYEIAHSRAGDKGNIVNLSLIPFEEKDYDYLYQHVTAAVVKKHLKGIRRGESNTV